MMRSTLSGFGIMYFLLYLMSCVPRTSDDRSLELLDTHVPITRVTIPYTNALEKAVLGKSRYNAEIDQSELKVIWPYSLCYGWPRRYENICERIQVPLDLDVSCVVYDPWWKTGRNREVIFERQASVLCCIRLCFENCKTLQEKLSINEMNLHKMLDDPPKDWSMCDVIFTPEAVLARGCHEKVFRYYLREKRGIADEYKNVGLGICDRATFYCQR